MDITSHIDPRQSKAWGHYLSKIGWVIEQLGTDQIFIKKVPILGFGVAKFQRPNSKIDFIKLDHLAKKHRLWFLNLEPHFKNYQEAEFKKAGFKKSNMILSHTSTILIDLTKSEAELLKSFSENARRNIKKATANKLRVKVVQLKNEADDREFRKFYELLKSLTEMKKFYIPGYDEFFKKMTAFKKTSILLFAYSQDPDKESPIAVIWLAGYNQTAFYVQTGITSEGYKLLANYLLVWEGLKLLKKLKYQVFDFEGVFDPKFPNERSRWKNFSEFKSRFHGEVIFYPPSYIKIYNPIFKMFYMISKILP